MTDAGGRGATRAVLFDLDGTLVETAPEICDAVNDTLEALGLPPAHRFWSDPPADWTQRRAWAGENLAADHALKED